MTAAPSPPPPRRPTLDVQYDQDFRSKTLFLPSLFLLGALVAQIHVKRERARMRSPHNRSVQLAHSWDVGTEKRLTSRKAPWTPSDALHMKQENEVMSSLANSLGTFQSQRLQLFPSTSKLEDNKAQKYTDIKHTQDTGSPSRFPVPILS